MAAPFPEAQFEALIYMLLGSLVTLLIAAGLYIKSLRAQIGALPEEDDGEEKLHIDNIGLSKRAEDVLEAVLEEPSYQNELPDKLEVSKATVSQAISELNDRHLVKRKKKANTYLIEPRKDKLKEEQR